MPATIVEYMLSGKKGSCGYCKSKESNSSNGMWAHTMSVHDYQDLIDRGWRRSGKYCYKPNMTTTCCPLYTIKCDALKFKLTKSQKKLLKKVSKYIIDGKKAEVSEDQHNEDEHDQNAISHCNEMPSISIKELNLSAKELKNVASMGSERNKTEESNSNEPNQLSLESSIPEKEKDIQSENISKRTAATRPGNGIDAAKPLRKKAKLVRMERKNSKECNQTLKKAQSQEKSLEDFINLDETFNLELRLVQSCPPSKEFEDSFKDEHEVYKKYQMTIHKDSPQECSTSQFRRFLVDSPLHTETKNGVNFGSFHHQYWLKGKLIGVGVIDILPKCISSVYFFYDPEYSFLSLGTYSSMREITLVRSLNQKCSDIQFYYMGFYIHSCPKMSYKARYSPSYLLCPETYTWQPVEEAKKKLDISKYSRLNNDPEAKDENEFTSLRDVLVLFQHTPMTYSVYKQLSQADIRIDEDEDEKEIKDYGILVGKKCAKRMFLFRPAS